MSINATDLRLPGCQPSHSSAPGLLRSYASRRGGRISRDLSVTPLRWHLRVGCVSSPRRTCTPARRQASGIKWEVNGSASPGFHAATFDTDVAFASAAARGNVNSSGASGGTQMLPCSLSELSAGQNSPFFSQFLQISRQTCLVCVC